MKRLQTMLWVWVGVVGGEVKGEGMLHSMAASQV